MVVEVTTMAIAHQDITIVGVIAIHTLIGEADTTTDHTTAEVGGVVEATTDVATVADGVDVVDGAADAADGAVDVVVDVTINRFAF